MDLHEWVKKNVLPEAIKEADKISMSRYIFAGNGQPMVSLKSDFTNIPRDLNDLGLSSLDQIEDRIERNSSNRLMPTMKAYSWAPGDKVPRV